MKNCKVPGLKSSRDLSRRKQRGNLSELSFDGGNRCRLLTKGCTLYDTSDTNESNWKFQLRCKTFDKRFRSCSEILLDLLIMNKGPPCVLKILSVFKFKYTINIAMRIQWWNFLCSYSAQNESCCLKYFKHEFWN